MGFNQQQLTDHKEIPVTEFGQSNKILMGLFISIKNHASFHISIQSAQLSMNTVSEKNLRLPLWYSFSKSIIASFMVHKKLIDLFLFLKSEIEIKWNNE